MIIETVQELRRFTKNKGTIGFVPTMGYLHEGHLSLIKAAKAENDLVVVSIFVNPTQFAPNEDFESYPRDLDRDAKLAYSAGADIIFHPSVNEMYPVGASTIVTVEGDLPLQLCGASRPTHFQGVTSVVNILFNIVKPDRAYFGQKDAQQAILIQKMVRDLHMDLRVVVCPIVREEDGLAMSSRNTYLSEEERAQALVLSRGLANMKSRFNEGTGTTDVSELLAIITNEIATAPIARVDYVEIRDYDTLLPIDHVSKKALAAVAVYFGKTRLIDNAILEVL